MELRVTYLSFSSAHFSRALRNHVEFGNYFLDHCHTSLLLVMRFLSLTILTFAYPCAGYRQMWGNQFIGTYFFLLYFHVCVCLCVFLLKLISFATMIVVFVICSRGMTASFLTYQFNQMDLVHELKSWDCGGSFCNLSEVT